jgi:ribosomal-protein-alanine N-acetyltransferase
LRLKAGSAVVREWTPGDVPELAQLANDRRIWINLRDAFPHPYGIEDAERFIGKACAMSPQTYLAIEVSGTLAGGIGYTLHEDVERVGAEVGYWLGAAYWGRGLATAAVKAVTQYAFEAHPELRRLWAVPYVSNPASAAVLRKAGYLLEGVLRESAIKDGKVLDQWMYATLRRDREDLRPEGGGPEARSDKTRSSRTRT